MKSIQQSLVRGTLKSCRRINAIDIEKHFDILAFTSQGHSTVRIIRAALRNTVQTERSKESKKNGRVI